MTAQTETAEPTRLVHFKEYPLSKSDLNQIPQDHAAAISVACYAASEVNAILKAYLASIRHYSDCKAMDSASFIQQFVLARILSAKLFEFQEFLQLGGKKKITTDAELLRVANESLASFEKLKGLEGFRVARDLRHEATNHYSLSAAKKNWGYVADSANCTLYVHRTQGNSFYPLGEEVMFIGRLNRSRGGAQKESRTLDLNTEWFAWTKQAAQWLHTTQATICRSLLFSKFPNKFPKKSVYWIDPSSAPLGHPTSLPLFVLPES